MGFCRVSPFLFVIATAVATRPPLCLQPQQHTSDTSSTLNCLCPVGSPTIVNSLDPYNAGVERLVVYFYRKLETGQIIRFIPYKELQHRIPDFPREYGTVKDISYHPSFKNMFENSASKEIRDTLSNNHNSHPNDYHGSTEFPPWLIPVDEDSTNNIPYIRVTPYPDVSESHLPHIEMKPVPDQAPNSNEYASTDVPSDNNEPYDNNPDNFSSEGHPNDATIELTSGENTEETEKPSIEHENPLDFFGSSSSQHPLPNSEPSDERHKEYPTSIENESHQNVDDNTSGPLKTLSSSENPHQKDLGNDGLDELSSPSPNVAPLEKQILVPQKDDHGRIVGWTTQTITSYWEANKHPQSLIKVHPVPYNWAIKPHVSPLPHIYVNKNYENIHSFDNWLKEQLNITTINGNKIPTNPRDITALHTEIRNVLLQNGLIVTNYGTLIDGRGKESNLDNLKLRPILIGKSISYNRFLKHVDSDVKFEIPSNVPFLEGLLLTMIRPPKILGIVPLSITSLPDNKPGRENNGVTNHGHAKPVEQKTVLKILPINQVVSFRKDSKAKKTRLIGSQRSGPKVVLLHPRSGSKLTLIKKHLGPKLDSIRQRLRPSLISKNNQNKTDSERRQAFAKKAEKESDYWARWKDNGKPASEEVPDFRIIGGVSATVSGTPLLNRGRSGFAHLTHPLS